MPSVAHTGGSRGPPGAQPSRKRKTIQEQKQGAGLIFGGTPGRCRPKINSVAVCTFLRLFRGTRLQTRGFDQASSNNNRAGSARLEVLIGPAMAGCRSRLYVARLPCIQGSNLFAVMRTRRCIASTTTITFDLHPPRRFERRRRSLSSRTGRCASCSLLGGRPGWRLESAMKEGAYALASSHVPMPHSRSVLSSRSCNVQSARFTCPLAWLVLAQSTSTFSSYKARLRRRPCRYKLHA